ncbi:MAG: hypothetical protein ACO3PO_14725, partial [Limisphaerales bacterium]
YNGLDDTWILVQFPSTQGVLCDFSTKTEQLRGFAQKLSLFLVLWGYYAGLWYSILVQKAVLQIR